jgi:hypothetical protein
MDAEQQRGVTLGESRLAPCKAQVKSKFGGHMID